MQLLQNSFWPLKTGFLLSRGGLYDRFDSQDIEVQLEMHVKISHTGYSHSRFWIFLHAFLAKLQALVV